jgi:hypothetical protein
MFSNSNHPPTYKHVLLRDWPVHAPTVDHYNPRSCHAGRPLAPLNTVLQQSPAALDLGTALEPSFGRGLHTPLVFAAPMSTIDLGRAADLSTHTDDMYRCNRPAPSGSKDQSNTQRPLMLAYVDSRALDPPSRVGKVQNGLPVPSHSTTESLERMPPNRSSICSLRSCHASTRAELGSAPTTPAVSPACF